MFTQASQLDEVFLGRYAHKAPTIFASQKKAVTCATPPAPQSYGGKKMLQIKLIV